MLDVMTSSLTLNLAFPVAAEVTGGTSFSPFNFALNFSFCAYVKFHCVFATTKRENSAAAIMIRLMDLLFDMAELPNESLIKLS
jgi:hypothetical protein